MTQMGGGGAAVRPPRLLFHSLTWRSEVDSPYYLLLRYDEWNADKGAIVCGTHREGVDDPSKLRAAEEYVSVNFDDYRLARETGKWRFRPDRGVYKE